MLVHFQSTGIYWQGIALTPSSNIQYLFLLLSWMAIFQSKNKKYLNVISPMGMQKMYILETDQPVKQEKDTKKKLIN